jgi:hypothetical protein
LKQKNAKECWGEDTALFDLNFWWALRLSSMAGVSVAELASNQSLFLALFLPKICMAVLWMVSEMLPLFLSAFAWEVSV